MTEAAEGQRAKHAAQNMLSRLQSRDDCSHRGGFEICSANAQRCSNDERCLKGQHMALKYKLDLGCALFFNNSQC